MTIKIFAVLAVALVFTSADLSAAAPHAAQDGNPLKCPSATPNACNEAPASAPKQPPSDGDTAASALALQAVTRISEEAIAAADRNAAAAENLFQKLVLAVGALGVIFAGFGISSIRSLTRNLRANAKEQVNKALTDMRTAMDRAVTETTQTAAQVNKALTDMATAVAENTQITAHARDVYLNTAEATRFYTLAGFADVGFDQQEYFKLAAQACMRAREAAEQMHDTKQVAWTYSFEALCLKAQKDFRGAVKAAEESESLYQRDDPTLYFNLACYLCLAGEDDRAVARLQKAFDLDKDGSIRAAALTEEDFHRWRIAGLHPELVGAAARPGPQPS